MGAILNLIRVKQLKQSDGYLTVEDEVKINRLRSFGAIGAITTLNSGNVDDIVQYLRESNKNKKFVVKQINGGISIWRTK